MTAPTLAPGAELLSTAQAADRLGVTTKTIRRYIATGTLTGYRVGPKLLKLRVAEVEALAVPAHGGGA